MKARSGFPGFSLLAVENAQAVIRFRQLGIDGKCFLEVFFGFRGLTTVQGQQSKSILGQRKAGIQLERRLEFSTFMREVARFIKS